MEKWTDSGLPMYVLQVLLAAAGEGAACLAGQEDQTGLAVILAVGSYLGPSYLNALFSGDARRAINPKAMAERDQDQDKGSLILRYLFLGHAAAFSDVRDNIRDLKAREQAAPADHRPSQDI